MQAGNDRIRGEAARAIGADRLARLKKPAWSDNTRELFIREVKESGKEVADYLGIKFAKIPKGKIRIGRCNVTLTRDFELSACEITQAQWEAVIGTRPWSGQPWGKDGPELPAYYVNYADCQELISRLNACGGRKYRLPTLAEWKHAAAGGTDSLWGFGEKRVRVPEYAYCSVKYQEKGGQWVMKAPPSPQAVGKLKPNPWGLYDMAGNVSEWCHEWYDYWYYREGGDKIDTMGPKTSDYSGRYPEYAWRVVCGAHFGHRRGDVLERAAARHCPHYRGFIGFRLHRRLR